MDDLINPRHVTFYGHFTGHSSFPVVCKALARWLYDKEADIDLCDLRRSALPACSELEKELKGIPRVTEEAQDAVISGMRKLAAEGSYTRAAAGGRSLLWAFPEWSWALPRHEGGLWGYHVCDVDTVPDHWVVAINENETAVFTPSRWCKTVLKHCGVKRRIDVVRHGIDAAVFKPLLRTYRNGPPTVRFFCSSMTGNRKGLHETLVAWRIVQQRRPGIAKLVVRAAGVEVQRACYGVPALSLETGEAMSAHAMARMLNETDLLLAPSRAEGFGMIPLTAAACGTPSVLTDCTGHAEFAHKLQGARLVETGDFTNCPPGPGKAPLLEPQHLADVLEQALLDLDALAIAALENSAKVRTKWAWPSVLDGSALEKLT